jgi:hypothetical protein
MEAMVMDLEHWVQEIHHLYQVHVAKLEQTNAWDEAWVQKLYTLTNQVETWVLPKLGSFRKDNAQDDKNISTRKRSKLPKSKGKNVLYFLCYRKHFSMD